MKILICDDEKNQTENISGIVKNLAKGNFDACLEIKCFEKPFEAVEDIEKNGTPDIALLDICMPGISGTEIAEIINKRSEGTTDIIFLTTSSEFAVEAFALHACDYIVKPYSDEKLIETLTRVIKKREKRHFVPIICGKETFRVDLFSVLYAESINNSVEIHLKHNKKLKTYTSLKKIMELFKGVPGFTLVGVSYIVNFRAVQIIHTETMEMSNGEIIPIPRRLRSDIKKQYFDFYKREAMEN